MSPRETTKRRKTLRDDTDRGQFLDPLAQMVEEHGVRLHGFCLMPNHYHLLVETPRALGGDAFVDRLHRLIEK
jgi:REP element-mobilizing transposase RayT